MHTLKLTIHVVYFIKIILHLMLRPSVSFLKSSKIPTNTYTQLYTRFSCQEPPELFNITYQCKFKCKFHSEAYL